jgi:hypothetical protein
MLFLATVARWQCDSWKRVRSATTGTQYLLNTNRLDSIIPRAGGLISTLYYFDNPLDYRDRGNYMILIMTRAQLITQMDTALGHASITLNMYTDNKPSLGTVATTIAVGNFAYAVADENDATRSWVTYTEAGWDIKTVLVNHTLAAMLALVV